MLAAVSAGPSMAVKGFIGVKVGEQFARDLACYSEGFTLYPKCLKGMSADGRSTTGFVSKSVVQTARGKVD